MNVTVNMLADQHRLISSLAFDEDRSLGSKIRMLIRRGLEAERPDLAAVWSDCRRNRLVIKTVTVAAGLVAVWHAMQPAAQLDMRRAPARVRIVRQAGRRVA